MFQKVTIYDNSDGKNRLSCQFRSEKALLKFMEKYEFIGGCKNFSVDIWSEQEFPYAGIPVIPANNKGWNQVLSVIYPSIVK